MRIWAHRGCSCRYPENTLTAFREACRYDIEGIELDVHLTKDGEIAVIHDETIGRTVYGDAGSAAEAAGADYDAEVRSFTLRDLQELPLLGTQEHIPSLREVLELMRPVCRNDGIRVNIEIKTNKIEYPGLEAKTASLVREYGLMDRVVFSSFNPRSLWRLRRAAPEAEIGILARRLSQCLLISRTVRADALHPGLAGLDRRPRTGLPVRVWSSAPTERLFPAPPDFPPLDLAELEAAGVTDLFTNVPERYCALRNKPK